MEGLAEVILRHRLRTLALLAALPAAGCQMLPFGPRAPAGPRFVGVEDLEGAVTTLLDPAERPNREEWQRWKDRQVGLLVHPRSAFPVELREAGRSALRAIFAEVVLLDSTEDLWRNYAEQEKSLQGARDMSKRFPQFRIDAIVVLDAQVVPAGAVGQAYWVLDFRLHDANIEKFAYNRSNDSASAFEYQRLVFEDVVTHPVPATLDAEPAPRRWDRIFLATAEAAARLVRSPRTKTYFGPEWGEHRRAPVPKPATDEGPWFENPDTPASAAPTPG